MSLQSIKKKSRSLIQECIQYHEVFYQDGNDTSLPELFMENIISLGLAIKELMNQGHDHDGFCNKMTELYNMAKKVMFSILPAKNSGQIEQQNADRFLKKSKELLFLLSSWKKLAIINF